MTTTAPTMPAAVFADIGKLELVERPVPRLRRPGDVLLDVQSSGICGTDLHILSTPPGFEATPGTVLGHEFVGVVRETGAEVMSLAPGDRVVVAPNVACGQCSSCRRGLRNHCENFTTHGIFIDGGLAPHVVVPATQCFPISHDVPSHIAALAEPLSTVVNGVKLAEERRQLATTMVAAHVVDPRQEDAAAFIRAATAGAGADVVIDAVGSQ